MPFLRGVILRRKKEEDKVSFSTILPVIQEKRSLELVSKNTKTTMVVVPDSESHGHVSNYFNEIRDERTEAEKRQLLIEGLDQPVVGNPNKNKGNLYEYYVGGLYKSKGYNVEYNGREKNSNDMGIDLFCYYKNYYVVCVQCKCYDVRRISRNDIFQFYGAFKYYASRHLNKTVVGALWIARKIKEGSQLLNIIEMLGIRLYDGKTIPKGFKL